MQIAKLTGSARKHETLFQIFIADNKSGRNCKRSRFTRKHSATFCTGRPMQGKNYCHRQNTCFESRLQREVEKRNWHFCYKSVAQKHLCILCILKVVNIAPGLQRIDVTDLFQFYRYINIKMIASSIHFMLFRNLKEDRWPSIVMYKLIDIQIFHKYHCQALAEEAYQS